MSIVSFSASQKQIDHYVPTVLSVRCLDNAFCSIVRPIVEHAISLKIDRSKNCAVLINPDGYGLVEGREASFEVERIGIS